ncbi:hypothetical protein PR048_021323 [Dryococelus australis]|uniref:BESS domain-containing protein n=1 Tax=Dryococelus australis TaxID=614101 RepID=A0ABQ9GXX6_9NEOP|nr:hypothetical protein PR048_021323 [Dryococelus australis]
MSRIPRKHNKKWLILSAWKMKLLDLKVNKVVQQVPAQVHTEVNESLMEAISRTGAKEDDVDLFYKSLAVSVKKLPTHLQSQAKLKSLQIVIELEHRANTEALSVDNIVFISDATNPI